ncbi:phage tail protein [Symbiopectobacterium purcellii]|uniref:Phage tail protein n=2 Tax=Symbiopectobacterium purcellii TaxID=2871826 RepID=A0ABX9AY86_9ENTR|nr:phage tail protein [Symbiopectobacterium purcellii]
MINGAHGGVGGNSVVLPDATNLLTYLQDKPSMVVSGNTALVNGAGFAAVYDFKRSSSNYATLIAYPITNVGNIAVRYFENPSWGSWRPQATLDTDQTITGKKIFNRSSEALQIKALADNQSCFIRGQKADDTPHWYIGKGGADFAVAWANQHSTAANSITLRENGNIDIQVLAGKTLNAIIGGVSGRFLSQGHNAESDANGIWKVPGSAGLTPAAIGALAVSDIAGIPLPFPGAVAPSGWLKCNGQSFNTTQYPVLASRYPSGVLPDLRAEFIRGADDGRGVDTGRVLLSAQGDAIRNITGKFANNGLAWSEGASSSVGEGAFTRLEGLITSNNNVSSAGCQYAFNAGNVVPVANENRPRNIAFNYIVRAA